MRWGCAGALGPAGWHGTGPQDAVPALLPFSCALALIASPVRGAHGHCPALLLLHPIPFNLHLTSLLLSLCKQWHQTPQGTPRVSLGLLVAAGQDEAGELRPAVPPMPAFLPGCGSAGSRREGACRGEIGYLCCAPQLRAALLPGELLLWGALGSNCISIVRVPLTHGIIHRFPSQSPRCMEHLHA